MKTHSDLNALQTKFHELDLDYSNKRNQIDSLNDHKIMMMKQLKDLQNLYSTASAEIERLRRELYTQEQLTSQAEENFRRQIEKSHTAMKAMEEKYNCELENSAMAYEDLRVLGVEYFDTINELRDNIASLEQ